MQGRLYEAMFLVDAAKAGSDLPGVIRHVAELLGTADARIERIEKWSERRLSYPVKHVDKGVYILTYFHTDPERIQPLRRQVALSEEVLRVLITRPEVMSEVQGDLFDAEGRAVADEPAEAEEEKEPAVAQPPAEEAEAPETEAEATDEVAEATAEEAGASGEETETEAGEAEAEEKAAAETEETAEEEVGEEQ